MHDPWLPGWLSATWAGVFVLVLGVHLVHLVAMRGRVRAWHATHVAMAAGMVVMFWPTHTTMPTSRAGAAAFAAAAAVVLGASSVDALRRRHWTWVWALAAVDLAAMAYMFAPATRSAGVTAALVVWWLAEAAGWASGALVGAAQRDLLSCDLGALSQELAPARSRTPGAGPDLEPGVRPDVVAPRGPAATATLVRQAPVRHHAAHARSIRVTLTLMGLGMAQMLLAMQLGMATPGRMPGM